MKKLAALSLLLVPACTVTTSTPGFHASAPSAQPPAVASAAPASQPAPPPPGMPCIDAGPADITDRVDAAYPLAPTSTTTLCMQRGDIDVFAITAPPGAAGTVVRFTVHPEIEMAPVVEILDGNRRNDRNLYGKKGEEVRGWAYVAGGTTFYLKIRQTHGATESYTLALESGALPEANEPNNTMEFATPLAIGASTTGFLARPFNDEAVAADWYRVELPTPGHLAIDVDMSQGISSRVVLFDSNRKQRGQKGGGRGERYQHSFEKLAAGTYYLKLDSSQGPGESDGGELPESLTRAYTIAISR
jgi:hypothetical protein